MQQKGYLPCWIVMPRWGRRVGSCLYAALVDRLPAIVPIISILEDPVSGEVESSISKILHNV